MSSARHAPPFPVIAYSLGNALGMTTGSVATALAAGRSGLEPASSRFELPFETACGPLAGDLPALTGSLSAWDGRSGRLAVAVLDGIAGAVEAALRRHGRDRVAVVLGTSTGGIASTERAFDAFRREGRLPVAFDFARQHAFDALVELIRHRTGIAGPGWVVSTACSASGKVFGTASRLLRAGLADAVLVGGIDTLCETTLRGFGSLGVLSPSPCRPFCRDRDGTSLGEGAAFLLLAREGDGPARLLGVGESTDAHHMSHPHPEGSGARAAMEEALRRAGLAAEEVDHVNAHGTGTRANDVVEAAAIAAVVGTSVPVSSTKGYTGHLLGAAAATEAIFSILSIERGFVPASLGASPLDPAVTIAVAGESLSKNPIFRQARSAEPEGRSQQNQGPLREARVGKPARPRAGPDFPTGLERRDGRVRTVLSNSFAFGGNNVSLLLGGPA